MSRTKKTRREREAVTTFAPLEATGWKPLVWWLVIAGAGEGDHKVVLRRRCATLAEGREEARALLTRGMVWAWVEERTSRTKTV